MSGIDANSTGPHYWPLPTARAMQPQHYAFGDMVTVEVGAGDKKRAFNLYRGLLTFYSGYFRGALRGPWTESESSVVKLESEDPLVFERFVLWLYTNKIADETLETSSGVIIDLWLFADRRDIPLLMNEMISDLRNLMADRWMLPTSRLHDIYENTTDDSALRRMILWSTPRISCSTIFANEELWPRDALVELLKLTLAQSCFPKISQVEYKKAKMCPTYHTHEESFLCTKESQH